MGNINQTAAAFAFVLFGLNSGSSLAAQDQCYARAYTNSHLAVHPQQTVTPMTPLLSQTLSEFLVGKNLKEMRGV